MHLLQGEGQHKQSRLICIIEGLPSQYKQGVTSP